MWGDANIQETVLSSALIRFRATTPPPSPLLAPYQNSRSTGDHAATVPIADPGRAAFPPTPTVENKVQLKIIKAHHKHTTGAHSGRGKKWGGEKIVDNSSTAASERKPPLANLCAKGTDDRKRVAIPPILPGGLSLSLLVTLRSIDRIKNHSKSSRRARDPTTPAEDRDATRHRPSGRSSKPMLFSTRKGTVRKSSGRPIARSGSAVA